MCNLYSMTRARQEIIDLANAMTTSASVGNLEPLTSIFPDQFAPVVRNTDRGMATKSTKDKRLVPHNWDATGPYEARGRKEDR